jgi:hypothetical protein
VLEASSDVLLVIVLALFGVYRIFGHFILKKKHDVDFSVKEEAIKNEVKQEIDPMSISELVDRANARWGNRKNNKKR